MENITFHCLLCENSRNDFKSGIFCSLTDEKPKFLNKCPNKSFEKRLEKKIEEINTKLKLVENTKPDARLHAATFLSFSIIILLADYFLSSYLWDKGWITTILIIIGAAGLGLIPFAIAPINKLKTELKLAKDDKIKLDNVLLIYGYSYDIDILIQKNIHGFAKPKTQIKIYSRTKS